MSSPRQPKYELYDVIYRKDNHQICHYGVYVGFRSKRKNIECVYHLTNKFSSGDSVKFSLVSLEKFSQNKRCRLAQPIKKSQPSEIETRIKKFKDDSNSGNLKYKLLNLFGEKKGNEWNCEEVARYIVTGKTRCKQADNLADFCADVADGAAQSFEASKFVFWVGAFISIAAAVFNLLDNQNNQ